MLLSDVLYAAARAAHKLRSPGQTLSAADLADGLLIANQIVDQWAARKAYAYSESFPTFTLTANHAPHLIGPGLSAPDFAAAVRPQTVESASLILNTVSPNVEIPLRLRDDAWWAGQRVKGLGSTVPTDLYYTADWPNGALNFWPVPKTSYGVRLQLWTVLAQFATVGAAFSAPPAYLKAMTLTIAEEMCDWSGKPLPAFLPGRAARARAILQMANTPSPRISTADFGTRSRGRGGFNYYSGL